MTSSLIAVNPVAYFFVDVYISFAHQKSQCVGAVTKLDVKTLLTTYQQMCRSKTFWNLDASLSSTAPYKAVPAPPSQQRWRDWSNAAMHFEIPQLHYVVQQPFWNRIQLVKDQISPGELRSVGDHLSLDIVTLDRTVSEFSLQLVEDGRFH